MLGTIKISGGILWRCRISCLGRWSIKHDIRLAGVYVVHSRPVLTTEERLAIVSYPLTMSHRQWSWGINDPHLDPGWMLSPFSLIQLLDQGLFSTALARQHQRTVSFFVFHDASMITTWRFFGLF